MKIDKNHEIVEKKIIPYTRIIMTIIFIFAYFLILRLVPINDISINGKFVSAIGYSFIVGFIYPLLFTFSILATWVDYEKKQ